MAVLYATDKLHTLATFSLIDGFSKVLVEIVNELAGIFRFEVSSVMRDDFPVFQRDDVAANGKIVVCHVVAYARSFQRSAAFIDLVEVVTQNGSIRHFGTGRKAFGNGDETSTASLTGQSVHIGRLCVLQQCLVS